MVRICGPRFHTKVRSCREHCCLDHHCTGFEVPYYRDFRDYRVDRGLRGLCGQGVTVRTVRALWYHVRERRTRPACPSSGGWHHLRDDVSLGLQSVDHSPCQAGKARPIPCRLRPNLLRRGYTALLTAGSFGLAVLKPHTRCLTFQGMQYIVGFG
jgi:hypothetical protein